MYWDCYSFCNNSSASILIPVLIKLCNKLGIDYTGALPSSFKNEKDEEE